MTLGEKLREDLKDAMRKGDSLRRSTIRLLVSNIKYAEIEKRVSLSDGDILGLIAREANRHRESIESFAKGNRQDLIDKERAELAILESYLPPQMTHEEIVAEAEKLIAEAGARGLQDKGKIMSKLVSQLKGRAEGREINAVVTELLSKL